MLLTVEHNESLEAIEIFCDAGGLQLLRQKLEVLERTGGHVHLKTPSWAGDELTEETQGPANHLFNHLVIALKPGGSQA